MRIVRVRRSERRPQPFDVLGGAPNEKVQVLGRAHQPVEAHGGRADKDVLEA